MVGGEGDWVRWGIIRETRVHQAWISLMGGGSSRGMGLETQPAVVVTSGSPCGGDGDVPAGGGIHQGTGMGAGCIVVIKTHFPFTAPKPTLLLPGCCLYYGFFQSHQLSGHLGR